MSAFIGPWGQLVEFKCPSGLEVSSEARSSFKTTMGGRVVEQRGSRGRRTWQASLATAMPSQIAGLEALDLGVLGKPPWVWVPPNAQSQNLFSPEASVMAQVSGATQGGAVVADDGVLVVSTASVPAGGLFVFGVGSEWERVPVVPGVPFTASAYAAGAGGTLSLVFRDAAGAWVSSHAVALPSAMGRRSITITAPAGAVDAQLRITAGPSAPARFGNPAATWTTKLMPWSVGRGCNKATVEGLTESLQLAVKDMPGMNRSSHQFTVRELG